MLQFRGIGSTICTLLHRDEPGLAFWDPRKLRFYTQRPRFGTFRVAQAKMLHAMDTGQVMSRASRRAFPSNPSPRSLTCDPAGRDRLRHRGYVLIPQSGTVTYRSGPRTAPTHPPRPLVAQGPRSGPAALPATRVLAASQTGQSGLGLAPRRIRFPRTSRPRRQSHGAVEKPTCSAGPAVRPCGSSSDAGSCRAANRTIRFRLGPAPNRVSENIQAAPSKTGDRPQDTNNAKPRRQNHGVVEKPQGWKASLALHFSSGAGSCRAANEVIRIIMGRALKN